MPCGSPLLANSLLFFHYHKRMVFQLSAIFEDDFDGKKKSAPVHNAVSGVETG